MRPILRFQSRHIMWVVLSLISAVLLGFYDIFKKQTVVNNAIIPVLFYSTMVSGLMFLPLVLLSQFKPYVFEGEFMQKLFIEPLTLRQHLLIMGKTALILASWMFSYSAMKHLPITVVGPVNQLRPAISVILLFLIFQEKLTWLQWTGVVLAIVSFYLMNRSGKLEGIHFRSNKWVYTVHHPSLVHHLRLSHDGLDVPFHLVAQTKGTAI